MKKWIAVGVMMVALAQPAFAMLQAAPKGVKDLPGYVEFDLSEAMGEKKPNVSVMLEGAMIRMAWAASTQADSPLTFLLEQLKLVQVKVYQDIGEFYLKTRPIAEQKLAELKKKGWTPVVSVPEEDETVDVLVKSNDEFIEGLLVLVMGEDEIVFVNLAGEIDPEAMGKLIGSIGAGVFTGDFDFKKLLFSGQEDQEDEYEFEVEDDGGGGGEAAPSTEAAEE